MLKVRMSHFDVTLSWWTTFLVNLPPNKTFRLIVVNFQANLTLLIFKYVVLIQRSVFGYSRSLGNLEYIFFYSRSSRCKPFLKVITIYIDNLPPSYRNDKSQSNLIVSIQVRQAHTTMLTTQRRRSLSLVWNIYRTKHVSSFMRK